MNEVFISNFRRIIEQNLQIYNNSKSEGCVTHSKTVEHITIMTQKQLIILKPTVLLTRLEKLQSEVSENNIYSPQSDFKGFPDNEDPRIIEVEIDLSNQGSITSNIQEIKHIIETEDHEIPFIDVHSHTEEKLMLLAKEKEKEDEKQNEKTKTRRGRKKKEPINTNAQQVPPKTPLSRDSSTTLQSPEATLHDNSVFNNTEVKTLYQSSVIDNISMNSKGKREAKKSLRTRKPVMSASYYDAVEPSPKRKKKTRQGSFSTSTSENVPRDFLKIDTLPQNATASEIQIHFPKSLPLRDGKFKISVDLGKLNLPQEMFRVIAKPSQQKKVTTHNKIDNSSHLASQEKSELVKYFEIFSSDCENQNMDGSAYESPQDINNSTANLPAPQIGDIVIIQSNQNCDPASKVETVMSMDSTSALIDESARQVTSNPLGNETGISAPVINTGQATSDAAAGTATSIDGAQIEDFEFSLDIDSNVYRLYEYIENGGEIFHQANTNQQTENVVRSASTNNINNTPTRSIGRRSHLNVKENPGEIFHQANTYQQLSQTENLLRSVSSNSINNTPTRPLNVKENGREIFHQVNPNQQLLQTENLLRPVSSNSINNTPTRSLNVKENGRELFHQVNPNQQLLQTESLLRPVSSNSINNTPMRPLNVKQNGRELFHQVNTNQQLSQTENVLRSVNSNSINNTPKGATCRRNHLNLKENNEAIRRRQSVQIDRISITSLNTAALPELCENMNPAHHQKNRRQSMSMSTCEEILDLSVHKSEARNIYPNESVMDLRLSSSYQKCPNKDQENDTTSYENLIDFTREVRETSENDQTQRISLEEYQRRNGNTEKTSQSPQESLTEKKKGPKLCNKDCVACEENRLLNEPLDYEFDGHSSNTGLPSLAPNKAEHAYNYTDQSPATKDSGIDSEDCGNKSTGKSSNVSLRGDSTPIYRSREEEGLKSFHEIDDDALSIFINSVAGSPFYISDNNEAGIEDDDGCSSVAGMISTTPPPPKIETSEFQENSGRDISSDSPHRVLVERSSGPKKVFKIPKLMTSTPKTANAVYNTSVLNDLETKFLFPECPTSVDTNIKPLMNESYFTSTSQAIAQSTEKNVYNRKDVISDMFGNRPCFSFLAGNCNKPNCKFSHEIIDCNMLRMRLVNLNYPTLLTGYNFISRNRDLFKICFTAFCDAFSQRGDRKRLLSMVRDCQLYTETAPFLKDIVTGLTKTGLSQVDATKIIIEHFIGSTTEAMDILVDLILDSDVTQFLSTLESYVVNPRYRFKMEAINKLAFKCNRTKHFDVIQLLLKIILFQMPKHEVTDFQSAELVQFLDMVRNSQITQSVPNVYDNCISNDAATTLASTSRSNLPSMPCLSPLPSTSSLIANVLTKRV